MRVAVIAAVGLVLGCGPGWASGTIFYGSRAGMVVDVVSVAGLSTSHALIRTKHTRQNAIAFCREYVQKITPACITEELSMPLNDTISADCPAGEFVDFQGNRYRFKGPTTDKDSMVKYRLLDVASGQEADGSGASGYPTNMAIFKALCPVQAPSDAD